MILVILVLVVKQLHTCANGEQQPHNVKLINRLFFTVASTVYPFIPADRSFEVPRFVLFGFLAPVYYAYHLLTFGFAILLACVYMFWSALFISSMTPCNIDSGNSTSGCVFIDIRLQAGVDAALLSVSAIILVYSVSLKTLLKLTGGKIAYDDLFTGQRKDCPRLSRIATAIAAQILTVCFLKPSFTLLFVVVYFGGSVTALQNYPINRDGWFTLSLAIDVLFFVMLTPWFLFDKIDTSSEQFRLLGSDHMEEEEEEEEEK